MNLAVATAAATVPLSLTETKLHLRVDGSADDSLITALISAARDYVETTTSRSLINQTFYYYIHDWPSAGYIPLPRPPLSSVTGVTYVDDDGATTTWGTANYYADTINTPGMVVLEDDADWPDDDLRATNAIRVEYVAGYGTAGTQVPQAIRQAMLMAIGHWYENREYAVTTGAVPKTLPLAVDALLATYRIPTWDW